MKALHAKDFTHEMTGTHLQPLLANIVTAFLDGFTSTIKGMGYTEVQAEVLFTFLASFNASVLDSMLEITKNKDVNENILAATSELCSEIAWLLKNGTPYKNN